MMHSLTDPADNEITEPLNIKHEYFRKFQNILRKRDIRPELQDYERIQNKRAVQELKSGQGSDPTGLIREVFKHSGGGLLLSILAMANSIKSSKVFPQN